jgi:hypothetical protein
MKMDGQQSDTALKYQSQFQHIGCFSANVNAITQDAEQDTNYDPNACIALCIDRFPNTPSAQIIAAVHKKRCGCVTQDMGGMEIFTESDDYTNDCNEPCKYFDNLICGGDPYYWGVFKEYDFQFLGTNGAYDPWLKTWYTVVVVQEATINPYIVDPLQETIDLPLNPDDTPVSPERYYLHAASKETGEAKFQFQIRLPGAWSGIQFDLDSSRLVGLLSDPEIGRVAVNPPKWGYYFFVIFINTTLPLWPNMTYENPDDWPELIGKSLDEDYLSITGASAIVSKNNVDIYVYTMLREGIKLKESRHHIYFVSIPDGNHVKNGGEPLDFRVLQLFSNEKYGDVTAAGYRYMKMVYLYLARCTYDTTFLRKDVLWIYTPTKPDYLLPWEFTQDFWLYPGASCSEHLFNKSYSMLRNYSVDHNKPNLRNETGTLVMEIDIRLKVHDFMCNKETGCYQSMNSTIPYAGIFNAEPRIPLSLAAPTLISARFEIDGGRIRFLFDRATLKGATPEDIDNNIVPDSINYATTQTGQFGCDLLFDGESVLLLGSNEDGTYCEWVSADEIIATLPAAELPPIEVADSVFLKADTIYTVPRTLDGTTEYSMAASGGIQISLPDPLRDPEIVYIGDSTVDQCTPVYFDASNSLYTGGKPVYIWELVNAVDLTGRADRSLNATMLQNMRDILANTTLNNLDIFTMSATQVEAAVRFEILLTVVSRWGPNASTMIMLVKLDYPAPRVDIPGGKDQTTYRTVEVAILASGQASDCPGIDRRLGYQWRETTGKINLAEYPDIVATTKSLVIPPFVLEPSTSPELDAVNVYNFTIQCYVWADPDKFSEATATINIIRSDVTARLAKEDRLLTRGNPVILDARESQDADYPTPEGQTFKGDFKWWCVGPGAEPCYPELKEQYGDRWYMLGDTDNLTACRTDVNEKIYSAGRAFSTPLFVDYSYCKWARGVLMADTTNFSEGIYVFTVEASPYTDGRTDRREANINITKYPVPSLMLTLLNPDNKEKRPITDTLRFEGKVEEELGPTANELFSWNLLQYSLNNNYIDAEAKQAELEGRIYEYSQYIYIDVSSTVGLDPVNESRFTVIPDVPNMKILPTGALQPEQQYKVRLNVLVQETGVTAYVDVSFETAGLPPQGGTLTVDPRNGTMDFPRLAGADNWKCPDLPLKYHFGYLTPLGDELIAIPHTAAPLPVKSATFTMLPIGDKTTDYTLQIYVDVISSFGAPTREIVQIQSRPPENATELVNEMLFYVSQPGANPEEVLQNLSLILDIIDAPPALPGQVPSPEDQAVLEAVVEVLMDTMGDTPVTPQTATVQLKVLQDVVDAGAMNVPPDDNADPPQNLALNAMSALETMIFRAIAGGLFDVQDTTLMKSAFYAIGGVLPDVDSPLILAADQGLTRRLGATNQTSKVNIQPKKDRYRSNADLSRLEISHIMSTSFGRQEENHEPASHTRIISSCPSAYCDWKYIRCIFEQEGTSKDYTVYTCCQSTNSWTGCTDPPCWFKGNQCPYTPPERASPVSPDLRRRLEQNLKDKKGVPEKPAIPELQWEWQWSEELGYGSLIARSQANTSQDAGKGLKSSKNDSNASAQDKLQFELSLEGLENALSGVKARSAFPRQLQSANSSLGVETEAFLESLEIDEAPMLRDVQIAVLNLEREQLFAVRLDSRKELQFGQMSPDQALVNRTANEAAKQAKLDALTEMQKQYSQIITRSAVLRDTICKQALTQLTTSIEILTFPNPSFIIYMGKTRNMSAVNPTFVFPDKYIVPPNTPDEATADNPLTAFAFIYVVYNKNIYGWSDSAPPGNESTIITLNIMQADTTEIEVKNLTDPIRVFADRSLYSSNLCMYWDRFVPNTAGGAWSTKGLLNDAEGCLTTHLSDIGLFIDGRIPSTFSVDKAISYYLEDIIDGPEGSEYNYATAAVVGFIILLGTILALAGYIQDELIRERQRLGKADGNHFLDGDGISGPLTVDDAIAYSHVHDKHLFLVFTLWKVILRDHALLGVFHYNAAFTRPQRILCCGVMVTSVLAVNAMVYGVPREYVADDQWLPTGVIAGLVSFPLFVTCIFMFSSRPTPMRKRLIKRRTNNAEIEAIAKVRLDIEHESAKLFPKSGLGQLALPEYNPHGADVGRTTLLALPPPMPVRPSVPPPGMLALPPPPGGAPGGPALPVAGLPALSGLPQLPPLPALKPGPGLPALPPPPRYQPPMGRLTRAGLPEPGTRSLPPPPPPPAPTDGPRLAGIADGEVRTPPGGPMGALPAPGFGDMEATSLPHAMAPDGMHSAPPPPQMDVDVDADVCEDAPPRRALQPEAVHGMFQPAPDLPDLQGAPLGMPPGPPPGGFDNTMGSSMMDNSMPPMASIASGGFCTPRTPTGHAPDAGQMGFLPDAPLTPPSMPPVVEGISRTGIVHRGEPPSLVPPPSFMPGQEPPPPPGSLGLPPLPGLPPMLPIRPPMGFGLAPGVPAGLPPGFVPPPSLMMSRPDAIMPPGATVPQPPPPPPPKEDDAVFLRRARLHYMERAAKQQQEMMVDHGQEAPKDIPNRVFTLMVLCPYTACGTSICCHIAITLAYSMKFQRIAEKYWYYSTIVGLGLVLVVLELMRSAVMTIVELRKFEIRRRLAGGDFNRSRVRKNTEASRDPMHPKREKKKPLVPNVSVKKPPPPPGKPPPPPMDMTLGPPAPLRTDEQLNRPNFLPPPGSRIPPGAPPPPAGKPDSLGNMPFLQTPGGASLPVAPGIPKGKPPAVPAFAGRPPPGIPPLQGMPMQGGTPSGTPGRGGLGTAGGMPLLPGNLTPPGLGKSFGSTLGQTPPPPPPMPGGIPGSPSGSVASHLSKSLSEKMAANKGNHKPPPPGSKAATPTPPGSHRSGGSGRGAKPPPGQPPSSTLERSRAAKRGQ